MASPASRTDTLAGDVLLASPEFADPPDDPIELLRDWITSATEHRVREPLALVLATTDGRGHPSSRVVLLKEVVERGVVFTSHHASRKGRDLAAVPHAAGTLYWRETVRQVNLAGPVERLGDAKSDALFGQRALDAQATTAVSEQSAPLDDEHELHDRARELLAAGHPVPRPQGWGGYLLVVERIEFWQGSTDRLHRRLEYARTGDGWAHERLQP